jgi:hypothetical protein
MTSFVKSGDILVLFFKKRKIGGDRREISPIYLSCTPY